MGNPSRPGPSSSRRPGSGESPIRSPLRGARGNTETNRGSAAAAGPNHSPCRTNRQPIRHDRQPSPRRIQRLRWGIQTSRRHR
nr:MAG TPA: hypothetical protein [Caudoviricetes sp.]